MTRADLLALELLLHLADGYRGRYQKRICTSRSHPGRLDE